MENSCKEITFNELKKGQFIIITYYGGERDFIIAKVVTDKINETIEIDEIGESLTDKPRFDEVDTYFVLRSYILRKKIIKKENELTLEPGDSTRKTTISRMIIITKKALKNMAQKAATEKEEERKQAEKRENDFKTAMETVGLLEKQKKEKVIQNNYRKTRFTGQTYRIK